MAVPLITEKIVMDFDMTVGMVINDYNIIANQIDGIIIEVGKRTRKNIKENYNLPGHISGFINTDKFRAGNFRIGIYFYTQAINEDEALEEANWVNDHIVNLENTFGQNYIKFPIYILSDQHGDRSEYYDDIDTRKRSENIAVFFNRIRENGYDCGLFTTNRWLDNEKISLSIIKNKLGKNKELNLWISKFNLEPPEYKFVGWRQSDTYKYIGFGDDAGYSKFVKNVAGWFGDKINISDPIYNIEIHCTNGLYYGNQYYNLNTDPAYFKIDEISGHTYIIGQEQDIILTENDYDISFQNNYEASYDYSVAPPRYNPMIITVTGKGEFTGQITKIIDIANTPIGRQLIQKDPPIYSAYYVDCNLEGINYNYTGDWIKPDPIVKFSVAVSIQPVPAIDYKVSYDNNINVGTAVCIIEAAAPRVSHNLSKYMKLTFNIKPINIESSILNLPNGKKYKYTGSEITPDVEIPDFQPKYIYHRGMVYYYTTEYSDNIDIGIATIICKGIGPNVLGELTTTFRISHYDVSKMDWRLDPEQTVYDGQYLFPKIEVLDDDPIEGVDYVVSYIRYEGNDPEYDFINVGHYAITLTGIGEYTGTSTKLYTINPRSIMSYNIRLVDPYEVFLYDTTEKRPEIYLEDDNGDILDPVNYGVVYNDNIFPNLSPSDTRPSITVYGYNNYGDMLSLNFDIQCNVIDNCYAKYGYASFASIFRIDNGEFNLYADKECTLKLKEGFDYDIIDIDMYIKDDFQVISIDVEGKNYIVGGDTFYFRIINEEPSIDYDDDGIYNFGFINIEEGTAVGGYSFGDPDGESVPYPDENVEEGDNYDFEELSGMYLANYDRDNGRNIDRKGNSDYDDGYEPPERDDDGVYNFGDIDLQDESAVGGYDFGGLEDGVGADNISTGVYDFNKFSGDPDEWFEPGVAYELTNIPFYSTYSRNKSFDIRPDSKVDNTYFIYNSIIRNNRIRMCRSNNDIEKPCSSTGWVDIDDLLNLNRIAVGDYVYVYGKIYKYSSGNGEYIMANGEPMYVKGIIEDEEVEYKYAISEMYNSPILGYTDKTSIVSDRKVIN